MPVGRYRVVAVAGEDLDRDVVCPGVQVGAEAGRDDIGGAVEHERVDQAVAAAVIDVGVGVAVAPRLVV